MRCGLGADKIVDACFDAVSLFGFCTFFALEQRFPRADAEFMGADRSPKKGLHEVRFGTSLRSTGRVIRNYEDTRDLKERETDEELTEQKKLTENRPFQEEKESGRTFRRPVLVLSTS
jgi:hypothetical protein